MEAFRSDSQFNNNDDETTLSMSDLFKHIRVRWHWYVISFAAVFALAALYLLSAPYSYTRTVQVLLKSDSSQFMTTDLESLGVKPVNSAIIDEMFILGSPAVMQTVVERLGINNVYSTRKGLRRVDLYKKSPVEVELLDSLARGPRFALSMKISVGADSTFTIGSLRLPRQMGGRVSGEFSGTFGDTVSTPAGRIAVYATRNFDREWEGRSVKYSFQSVPVCARNYCESLSTEYDEEAGSVITLRISSHSEQKADDVLRGIVEAYNERWINDRNKIAMSTSQFIEERLGSIEDELTAVEGNITDYQSRHAIVDMEAVSSMYLQQSMENRRALEDLAQEIAAARYIKRELAADDITKLLPAMTSLAAGAPLQEMVRSYNEMVVDRNLRLQSMDAESPLLVKKTAAITEMRQAIIESIDQTLAILTERLNALQLIDSGTRHRLSDAPGQSRYLMSEDRKQKVMESLYVYLLQRREENQLSQAFTAYNTRMVTEPYGKSGPTSPNTRNVLAIAFVFALLIPTVIIYVREITNTKVRSREDLSSLSVPYIGEIPHVAAAVGKKRGAATRGPARQVMVRPHSGDIVDEAFRMVRTNIEFMSRREAGESSVLMVVSLVPGSGKTFVSLNLAATFAIKNKKVCLVDMDLRKGTLSQTVGSPRSGLTDILVGDARLDDVLIRDITGINGFDILPEGTIPPNPTELLFSPKVKEVIDELKRRYDYVLLDCPPVEAVADAKVLGKYADMSVFVVRAGLLERANLGVIQDYYESGRFNNIALVLNDTQEIHGVYGRYGYGAHYGGYTDKRR